MLQRQVVWEPGRPLQDAVLGMVQINLYFYATDQHCYFIIILPALTHNLIATFWLFYLRIFYIKKKGTALNRSLFV